MTEIIKLVSEYEAVTLITIFILFCLATKGVIDFIEWVKGRLNKWREQKNGEENQSKTVSSVKVSTETLAEEVAELKERVETLEKQDKRQSSSIDEMKDTLSKISNQLDDMADRQKDEAIATTRSALNRLYPELKAQGYLTRSQYETWSDLARIYLDRNGNHVFADKIIPEINAMEVRD